MATMQSDMPSAPSGKGELKVAVPEGWIAKPKGPMLDAEFALPKVEGDENDGRLTVMKARGSIEDNIQRWRDQFEKLEEQPVEEISVSGTKVTLVDFSGTYSERRRMMGAATSRPGYRMLAAIIPLSDGFLFVKGYGPENTMAKYAEDFRAFVETLASPGE